MLFLCEFHFNVCFPTSSQWFGTKTCIERFQEDGQTHFCVYSGWGYKIWGMKNLRSPSPRPWGYELMMIDIFDTPLKCLHVQLRICHKLTGKLNREVVLGSTSLDDPPQFITVLNFQLPQFSHYPWHNSLTANCVLPWSAETEAADSTWTLVGWSADINRVE